jgi:beta-N-acetylhexosaminidase
VPVRKDGRIGRSHPAVGRTAIGWFAVALLAGCTAAPAAPQDQSDARGQSAGQPAAQGGSATPLAAPTASPVDPTLQCVRDLPRDVRIGQTMLVTTPDLPRVVGWLQDGLIAGVLANGRLTRSAASALEVATTGTEYGAILATDDEGGSVQRYRDIVGAIPSAQRQAGTMSPAQVRELYEGMGVALGDWGVNMVLGPVVDVGHGPGIGSRAYSDDPDTVTEYAEAAARGLVDAGLTPVLKHFPGHGRTSGDTHVARVSGPPIDELRRVDLAPYRALLGMDGVAVLVGHTTIPGYSDEPSSQTADVVTGLLRDELGFDGLVVSDALGMKASAAADQGQALVRFVAAGGDVGIIGPGGSIEGRRAMRAALRDGTVTRDRLDEAVLHVLAQKGVDPCSLPHRKPEAPKDDGSPADPPVVNPSRDS